MNKTVKTLQEAATRYARYTTGYAPADTNEYQAAYKHFIEGGRWIESELKERDERIKELLKLLEKVEPVLLNSCDELEGQWGILSKSARLQSVHKEVREALSKNKESEKVD